jgi:hypothetical protein
MTKPHILIIAPCALAALVAASAAAETREVAVDAFTEIDAANGVRVEVVFGESPAVVIDGPRSQVERVEVDVRGDTLRIRSRSTGFFRSGDVSDAVVRVTTSTLSGVEAANGAFVQVAAVPADAALELRAVNGAVLELDGECASLDVEAHRGAVVDAGDLDCGTVHAEASMGGLVDVRAREAVTANASMGGHVEFWGPAEQIRSTASMGGLVERGDN